MAKLCDILMASGIPQDILTETINTVAEMIRGNQCNQEFLASVMAPSRPPRPAIVVLLMSMVNDKQPFVLRCAVLYCFQSFLYKNELGQSQIIQTLLPSTAEGAYLYHDQSFSCGSRFEIEILKTKLILENISFNIIPGVPTYDMACLFFSEHCDIRSAAVQWSLQQRFSGHVVGRGSPAACHRRQHATERAATARSAGDICRQPASVAFAAVYKHSGNGRFT